MNVLKMKQGRIKSNSICFTDICSDLTQFESESVVLANGLAIFYLSMGLEKNLEIILRARETRRQRPKPGELTGLAPTHTPTHPRTHTRAHTHMNTRTHTHTHSHTHARTTHTRTHTHTRVPLISTL